MSKQTPDQQAREVLQRYPVIDSNASLQRLGNRRGFSGAFLWQVKESAGDFCLRAWPPGDPSPERLTWIHGLMIKAWSAGLSFVPALLATTQGTTWVEQAGRQWELTSWMPGRADFQEQPTQQKIAAACTALALVHKAWAGTASATGPCPAIQRRLERSAEWTALARRAGRPNFSALDRHVRSLAERGWETLVIWLDLVPRLLSPWALRPFPLQPCLCDIWHDHVLFTGDMVTGLVDYGGAKVDQVAVDLARLLGSMLEDQAGLRAAGLEAYVRQRPLFLDEQRLVTLLDKTGALIGLANWLKWLCYDRRAFGDYAIVAQRMQALVERSERWQPGSLC